MKPIPLLLILLCSCMGCRENKVLKWKQALSDSIMADDMRAKLKPPLHFFFDPDTVPAYKLHVEKSADAFLGKIKFTDTVDCLRLGFDHNKDTYIVNGKWLIKDTMATIKMLYLIYKEQIKHSMSPFVIINDNNSDTLRYYRGDTIHVGPDKSIDFAKYRTQ